MTSAPRAQHKVPTFQQALNLLIQSQATEVAEGSGTFIEPTNRQIAAAINAKHGEGSITEEYIRKLRKGDIKSPSVMQASRIADVFQLPLDVFNATSSDTLTKVVDEVQRFVDSRRQMLSDEQEPPTVRALARTTRRLSPDGQARVVQYARRLQELEAMENETLPEDPTRN
ncbi:hypothetical protein ABZV52_30200 [Streptomyces sp. NPDC004735]|uniref:hypothetical protein n=1 Tax=Streptomyces TaxID=1883 RepID=UPI0033B8E088